MKLMFYINNISHGGAERVLVNIANRLSEYGHRCVFITSFTTPDFEYSLDEKVHRISLSQSRVPNSFKRNIVYIYRLRQLIKQFKPDVLLSFLPEANHRSLLASFGLRTKCVVSVRNDPEREYPTKTSRFLAKFHYLFADGVVFQTEDAKSWFPKIIQRKSEIIYNQVDENFYIFNSNDERHNIVTTGRLTKQKNHELLINAFALVAEYTEDNLLIYGDGPLKNKLQSLINSLGLMDRVSLMGVSNNVAESIGSAKMYVLSSDYEGMPNALMEAMAMGLPCISTDCPCGGPRLLFGDNLKECLTPVNDVNALAKTMILLLKDDNLRRNVGELFKERSKCFHPDVIINKWNNYLQSI